MSFMMRRSRTSFTLRSGERLPPDPAATRYVTQPKIGGTLETKSSANHVPR